MVKLLDNREWVRYKNHREESIDNFVFTDGMFDFHLNVYSAWKVKQVSFDFGETWNDFELSMISRKTI